MSNMFGIVLRNARLSKGLSLSYVSKHIIKDDGINISIQYLSDVERGGRLSCLPYFIEQASDILDIDVDWLYYLSGKFPMVEQDKRIPESEFKKRMKRFRNG